MPDEEGLVPFVLTSLARGAANYAANYAAGWILNSIFGGDGPTDAKLTQIQQTLNTVVTDLTAVQASLQNINTQLQNILENQTFQTLAAQVDGVQTSIQTNMNALHDLSSSSPTGAGSPAYDLRDRVVSADESPLIAIHGALVTGGQIAAPNAPGLLRIYAHKCAQACLADSAFHRGAFQVGGPFDRNYKDLQHYFQSLLSLQVQAMVLLFNAVNASGDNAGAQSRLTDFQRNLAVQCEEFLWAVESYVVACCIDESTLDVFRQANVNCDPIRKADDCVKHYFYNPSADAATPVQNPSRAFRARWWQATTVTPPQVLSLGFTPLQSQAGSGREDLSVFPQFGLYSGDNPVDPSTTAHIVFAPSNQLQWGVYRSTWLDLPDGSYTLAPTINTLIDPFSPTATMCGTATVTRPNNLRYTFGPNIEPSAYRCNFYNRSFGDCPSGASASVPGVYNFTAAYTLEAWVQFPIPGQSPAGAVATIVLYDSASGASFGIVANSDQTFDVAVYVYVNSTDGMEPIAHYRNISRTTAPEASVFSDLDWHQVAAVLGTDGSLSLYIDGQPSPMTTQAEGSNGPGVVAGFGTQWSWPNGFLNIGGQAPDWSFDLYPPAWNGPSLSANISEVRLWNAAREQSELRRNPRRRASASETNLAACFPLDTGAVRDIVTYNLGQSTLNFGVFAVNSPPPFGDWLTVFTQWQTAPAPSSSG